MLEQEIDQSAKKKRKRIRKKNNKIDQVDINIDIKETLD